MKGDNTRDTVCTLYNEYAALVLTNTNTIWQYEKRVSCTKNEEKEIEREEKAEVNTNRKIKCTNVTYNRLHNQLIFPFQLHSIATHCSEYETKTNQQKSGNESFITKGCTLNGRAKKNWLTQICASKKECQLAWWNQPP